MYHYEIKLCLIQITIGETHWLVDTLAGLDLSPIFTSKAMKHIILHGADYDLRLLWKNFKYSPVSVFDTMLAAKFLGEKKLGLADLRSEEHTSELQSRPHLVCRLLLEKKNRSAAQCL